MQVESISRGINYLALTSYANDKKCHCDSGSDLSCGMPWRGIPCLKTGQFLTWIPWGGIPCLKTGRFLFFFFVVATNVYINLFIKLSPFLLGMYCSDCLQQQQANQNPFLSLISRGRGPTHPYLCDVNASFDIFIKNGLNCRAILLTCFGLKCAVFKQTFHHFEAVNRKNNF